MRHLKTKTVHIYSLSCPDSGEVMYVGKTVDPEHRLKVHLSKSKNLGSPWNVTALNMWINELLLNDKSPLFDIIGTCYGFEYNQFETYWIRYYSCLNTMLLNHHNNNENYNKNPYKPKRYFN